MAVLVDDNEAMYARLSNSIKDGIQAIMNSASVYASKVLSEATLALRAVR